MQLKQLHKGTYTEFNDGYQLFLPLSLEGLIPEDDSIRLLSHISEGLNYTECLLFCKKKSGIGTTNHI